jgi:chromatin assembly factor 1 subunit A
MRLNAFFAKPKAPSGGTEQTMVESNLNSTTPSTSLLSDTTGIIADVAPSSPQKAIQKTAQSDYERCFLPFALPSHAILAPKNAFMVDADKAEAARSRLDEAFAKSSGNTEPMTLETLKIMLPARSRGSLKNATVADVAQRIHGSPSNPVDLADDTGAAGDSSLEMLQTMPMKYIHFGEDVRPPYYGTYTKPYSTLEARRLARNSLSRVRKDTNYEYDSEAEWEEPEEGEDLDSEGEDDMEEDADDDMDGFLDDEEDPQLKRRLLSGDLVPVSTGLCWEDAEGVSKLNDGSGAICTDFKEFKMEFLFGKSSHPFLLFRQLTFN